MQEGINYKGEVHEKSRGMIFELPVGCLVFESLSIEIGKKEEDLGTETDKLVYLVMAKEEVSYLMVYFCHEVGKSVNLKF